MLAARKSSTVVKLQSIQFSDLERYDKEAFPSTIRDCLVQTNLALRKLNAENDTIQSLVTLNADQAGSCKEKIARILHDMMHRVQEYRVDLESISTDLAGPNSGASELRDALGSIEHQMHLVFSTAAGISLVLDQTAQFGIWKDQVRRMNQFLKSNPPATVEEKDNLTESFRSILSRVQETSQSEFKKEMESAWDDHILKLKI